MARVAELSTRPQDMMNFAIEAIKLKEEHTVKDEVNPDSVYPADYSKRERDSIYVSFKNAISPLRVTLRLIKAVSDNPKYNKFTPHLKLLQEKVLTELYEKCETICQVTNKHSISRKGNSTETEVFFNKLVADFYRYMAEFTPKSESK